MTYKKHKNSVLQDLIEKQKSENQNFISCRVTRDAYLRDDKMMIERTVIRVVHKHSRLLTESLDDEWAVIYDPLTKDFIGYMISDNLEVEE